jgi:hypothetical protein
MLTAQFDSVERALWAALRSLEERVALMQRLAERARRRGNRAVASMFDEKRERISEDVRAIHGVIATGKALDPVGHEQM